MSGFGAFEGIADVAAAQEQLAGLGGLEGFGASLGFHDLSEVRFADGELAADFGAALADRWMSHRFGVEIEVSGMSRNAISATLLRYMGSAGRLNFNIVRDGSVPAVPNALTGQLDGQQEIVSVPLTWAATADRPGGHHLVAALLLGLTVEGAGFFRTTYGGSVGGHVHVDASSTFSSSLDPAERLARLLCFVAQYARWEPMIYAALGVEGGRAHSYAQRTDAALIRTLETVWDGARTTAIDETATLGRNGRRKPAKPAVIWSALGARPGLYRTLQEALAGESRYRGLNLQNLQNPEQGKYTVEFRFPNGTFNPSSTLAAVQLGIALMMWSERCAAHKLTRRPQTMFARGGGAMRDRRFSPDTNHAAYDFRVFLLTLGFIGPEFAAAREVMVANFDGSTTHKRAGRASRVYGRTNQGGLVTHARVVPALDPELPQGRGAITRIGATADLPAPGWFSDQSNHLKGWPARLYAKGPRLTLRPDGYVTEVVGVMPYAHQGRFQGDRMFYPVVIASTESDAGGVTRLRSLDAEAMRDLNRRRDDVVSAARGMNAEGALRVMLLAKGGQLVVRCYTGGLSAPRDLFDIFKRKLDAAIGEERLAAQDVLVQFRQPGDPNGWMLHGFKSHKAAAYVADFIGTILVDALHGTGGLYELPANDPWRQELQATFRQDRIRAGVAIRRALAAANANDDLRRAPSF